jgi:hypothetical protein
MVTGKHVGTEIASSDGVVSGELDSRPPFGVEQNAVVQPVGNVLLADLATTELPHSLRQGGLGASSDLDRSLEGLNVLLLHRHPKYTNRLVNTTPFVLHEHKEACTVLPMSSKNLTKTAARREKKVARPGAAPRKALAGQDGQTLGQRLKQAMAHETGRRHVAYRQVDLLEDVNKLAGRTAENPVMTQQMLSAIMRNTVSRSTLTSLLAAACHVNPLWLSDGIGQMTD